MLDGRTDARPLESYKLTNEPKPFGSGELIIIDPINSKAVTFEL